jgi:hypothetical protein
LLSMGQLYLAYRSAVSHLAPQPDHCYQSNQHAPDFDSQRATRPCEWSLTLSLLRFGRRRCARGWYFRSSDRPANDPNHSHHWYPSRNSNLIGLTISPVS